MIAAPATCIACGTAPRQRFRLQGKTRLLQCPRCLLGWWNWPSFDPAEFYDRDYFASADAAKGYSDYESLATGVRRTARSRLARLDRLRGAVVQRSSAKSAARNLIDLGCGTGLFLDEARRAGWQVTGREVSHFAVERAVQRGLDVRQATLEDNGLPRAEFDAVTLWDVIEHVRDPHAVLRAATAALRPGGVLALSTGDVASLCARWSGPRWHLFNLPEHLFFFTASSLRLMLRACGLRVVSVVRETNWVPLTYIVERLSKTGLLPRRERVDRLTLSSGLAAAVIPATLGDVLGVYAVSAKEAR